MKVSAWSKSDRKIIRAVYIANYELNAASTRSLSQLRETHGVSKPAGIGKILAKTKIFKNLLSVS